MVGPDKISGHAKIKARGHESFGAYPAYRVEMHSIVPVFIRLLKMFCLENKNVVAEHALPNLITQLLSKKLKSLHKLQLNQKTGTKVLLQFPKRHPAPDNIEYFHLLMSGMSMLCLINTSYEIKIYANKSA